VNGVCHPLTSVEIAAGAIVRARADTWRRRAIPPVGLGVEEASGARDLMLGRPISLLIEMRVTHRVVWVVGVGGRHGAVVRHL
jgi:hypothetical protein